jgi:hypothetical protein
VTLPELLPLPLNCRARMMRRLHQMRLRRRQQQQQQQLDHHGACCFLERGPTIVASAMGAQQRSSSGAVCVPLLALPHASHAWPC